MMARACHHRHLDKYMTTTKLLAAFLMPWSCRRDMTHDGAATIDTMFMLVPLVIFCI